MGPGVVVGPGVGTVCDLRLWPEMTNAVEEILNVNVSVCAGIPLPVATSVQAGPPGGAAPP